ncbi:class I SAM-dependent methyltransferase [Cytobacillus depressus]|uniref:Class I SAM-dependent methyltransferase n=1 Tax=Cytobacillus depressus TaxID=1602942 RepID=A0A6L3V498_9BACI|nr:class I SAM-dependent methyltransferase [Cytobacillus depressus]KAB2332303.1 class I SAM-dependent methyltransferase [Cytobacillus depressus]
MRNPFLNLYDFFMSPLEKLRFQKIRKELLAKANGNVLELGSGTGINFPLYEHAESVIAIEPNQKMIVRSKLRKQRANVPIEIIKASGERLPFDDSTFDTVVSTLVFCTISDVEKAMNEIKRVCKPGGKVLLFEHVLMDNLFLSNLQNWLTPAWKRICDGCCLNRDTLGLVNRQGFCVVKVERYFKGLFIVIVARNNHS